MSAEQDIPLNADELIKAAAQEREREEWNDRAFAFLIAGGARKSTGKVPGLLLSDVLAQDIEARRLAIQQVSVLFRVSALHVPSQQSCGSRVFSHLQTVGHIPGRRLAEPLTRT